jgi:uncharacterized Zn-finger protein
MTRHISDVLREVFLREFHAELGPARSVTCPHCGGLARIGDHVCPYCEDGKTPAPRPLLERAP